MADEKDPVETTDEPRSNDRNDRKPAKPEPMRDAPADDLEGKSPEEIAAELRRTRDALKNANTEARKHRLRKEELEDAERKREEAKLTEDERQKRERERERDEVNKTRARVTELEAENRRLRIDHAVYIEAHDRGFEYPQDVSKLIDIDRIEIDSETGRVDPKSVKDTVERLAKDRPGLLRARSGGGTPPRESTRRFGTEEPPRRSGRQLDAADQELIETGRIGGRM